MIRITERADIRAAASVLAEAFRDDPLFAHFFPDASRRRDRAVHTFRFIVSHAVGRGRVYLSPRRDAAAVWLPPGISERGLADQIRYGALRMLVRQHPRSIVRQMRASDFMHAIHERFLPAHRWYLSTLGALPSARGTGAASALVRGMLDEIDTGALPCALDTHNGNNISFYARFGFTVVHESAIPGTSVRHWTLLRPARAR